MKFKLPNLDYPYNALEPYVDEATMRVHHKGHHQKYVTELNTALADHPKYQELSLEELVASVSHLPMPLRTKVQHNGGGHYNHTLLWKSICPEQKRLPAGNLNRELQEAFGSVKNFKDKFTECAIEHFGSGYAWLFLDQAGKLQITSTDNQDSPIMTGGEPLFLMDVWEHAYYLKHQNHRPEYVKSLWNIVDWTEMENRLNSVRFDRIQRKKAS